MIKRVRVLTWHIHLEGQATQPLPFHGYENFTQSLYPIYKLEMNQLLVLHHIQALHGLQCFVATGMLAAQP
jgi:hypothetical protein